MPHTFEAAFALVQSLAKDFEANKVHFLSPADGLTDDEIKIVEGAAG